MCCLTHASSLSVTRTSARGRAFLIFSAMSMRLPTPTSMIFEAREYFSRTYSTRSSNNVGLLFRPAGLEDSRIIAVTIPHPPHTFEDQFLLHPRAHLLFF